MRKHYIKDATVEDIEAAANHERVRYAMGLGPDDYIDMAGYYKASSGNLAYRSPAGDVVLFPRQSISTYHVHFLCPYTRGAALRAVVREMINRVFTRTVAHAIVGSPPRDNRAVRQFGVGLGFSQIPDSEHTDDLGRVCDRYILRRASWATSSEAS